MGSSCAAGNSWDVGTPMVGTPPAPDAVIATGTVEAVVLRTCPGSSAEALQPTTQCSNIVAKVWSNTSKCLATAVVLVSC
jgi:hypothetical protein